MDKNVPQGGSMKLSRFGLLSLGIIVLLSLMLVIAACDDDKPTLPTMDFGVVTGTVYVPGRAVLPGVTVTIGTKTAVTDDNGMFILSGIAPGASVKVDFEIAGRLHSQKLVQVEKNRTTYITTTLFSPQVSTFTSTEAFVLNHGVVLDIPANAFNTPGGTSFTGTVRGEVLYFDPTIPECLDAFPGEFVGEQTDGTSTMIESYGFLSARFFDEANPGVELSLASGKQVSIAANVPVALLSNAPATIPLWYYDDIEGIWKEEGSATLVGSTYVGNVSHFTYWNFDNPIQIEDQSTLTGKVMSGDRGEPIMGAQVVARGIGYSGYTRVYSDANGEFEIPVKASAQVTLQAVSGANASTITAPINTPTSGGIAEVDDLVIVDRSFRIIGKLVDSAGNPVVGYGQVTQLNIPAGDMGFSSWLSLDAEGNFSANVTNNSNQTNFNLMFSIMTRSRLFSSAIPFAVPEPGNIWDFGTVTLRPGGNLTGVARISDGDWPAEASINFAQEGGSGEGNHYFASTDADGNFTLEGPPNTTLNNVRASAWINNMQYQSGVLTLRFPASGASRSLGTVTLSPVTK